MDNKMYTAIGMAEYILEGHSLNETATEFRVNRTTVWRQIESIRGTGKKELLLLYVRVKRCLRSNMGKKSK